MEAVDQNTLKVTWKPPPKEHWNGEILGYYVGVKPIVSKEPYHFETVEFSRELGKEHQLNILNLKYLSLNDIRLKSTNLKLNY